MTPMNSATGRSELSCITETDRKVIERPHESSEKERLSRCSAISFSTRLRTCLTLSALKLSDLEAATRMDTSLCVSWSASSIESAASRAPRAREAESMTTTTARARESGCLRSPRSRGWPGRSSTRCLELGSSMSFTSIEVHESGGALHPASAKSSAVFPAPRDPESTMGLEEGTARLRQRRARATNSSSSNGGASSEVAPAPFIAAMGSSGCSWSGRRRGCAACERMAN